MTDHTDPPAGVLLLTVDRLPAWILPAFGCTWASTPALDGLAGSGLVLDRVIATADEPCETLAALSGRGPESRDAWPLLEAAVTAGWSPAVITDDESFATRLPAGVTGRYLPPAASPRIAETVEETNLGRLFTEAVELVGGGHRLLWLHAASLGQAWDAPAIYRSAYLDPDDPPPPPGPAVPHVHVTTETDPDLVAVLRQVFAGQVTLLDQCLGRLLDAVARGAHGSRWTVVVVGVRGMPLGLHAAIGPLPLAPYGELVHLPAVLVDHGGRMAGQRYGGLLTPADIGATLVSLVGGGESHGGDHDPRLGQSLVPLLDEWRFTPRDRVIAVTSEGVAIATPAWHLVLPMAAGANDRPLLYAKPDDYFEACDVADRGSAVAEELERLARSELPAAWTTPLSAAAVAGA